MRFETPMQNRETPRHFWPERWWALVDFRIGIIPLPVYVLLVFIVIVLVRTEEVKSDAPTMIAVLVLGGFTCAELGARLPLLRSIGAAAMFATFIPSALVYYHLTPGGIESAIADFTKSTNFLYIFIASIIVGSILSMDRDVLIKGFLKIFVPLAVACISQVLHERRSTGSDCQASNWPVSRTRRLRLLPLVLMGCVSYIACK